MLIPHFDSAESIDLENYEPEPLKPITYVPLRPSHLPQIHDILRRSFWTGVDGTSTFFPLSFTTAPSRIFLHTPAEINISISSIRLAHIYSNKKHHRGNIWAPCRRMRVLELASGDIYHLSRGKSGLGEGSDCYVSGFPYILALQWSQCNV